jgi:hypothetical protein
VSSRSTIASQHPYNTQISNVAAAHDMSVIDIPNDARELICDFPNPVDGDWEALHADPIF